MTTLFVVFSFMSARSRFYANGPEMRMVAWHEENSSDRNIDVQIHFHLHSGRSAEGVNLVELPLPLVSRREGWLCASWK
jgi:hypothetical protein